MHNQRTCIASKRRCSLENVRTFTWVRTAPRFGVAVCFALAHCRSHAHGATTEPSLPTGMRLNPGKWPKDRPWEGYVRTRDALNSGDVEVVDGVFVCRAHSTQDGRRVGCREYEELMVVRLTLHAFSVVSACFLSPCPMLRVDHATHECLSIFGAHRNAATAAPWTVAATCGRRGRQPPCQ